MLDYYNKETPKYNSFSKRGNFSCNNSLCCDSTACGFFLGFLAMLDCLSHPGISCGQGKREAENPGCGIFYKAVRWKLYHFLSYHFGGKLISWLYLATRQPGESGV